MSTYDRLLKNLVSTWFDRLLRNSRQVPGGLVGISTDFVKELVILGLPRINKLVTTCPTDLIVRFQLRRPQQIKSVRVNGAPPLSGAFFSGVPEGVEGPRTQFRAGLTSRSMISQRVLMSRTIL